MSFSYLKQLPTPEEIKQTYPLSEACQKIKQERDPDCPCSARGIRQIPCYHRPLLR